MSATTTREQQRTLALTLANEKRMAAAGLKAEIRKAGRRGGATIAGEAIKNADSVLTFETLLRAVPRCGKINADRMLARARIDPGARVDSKIPTRRRRILAFQLWSWANR